MEIVELELCANCKKEIPHTNYVMHTAHCARNITLCPICQEPIAKAQLESHKRDYHIGNFGETISSSLSARRANQNRYTHSNTNSTIKSVDKRNSTEAVGKGLEKVSLDKRVNSQPLRNGKAKSDLIPCKFCDLELSKAEITDHENYCGSRTDKCNACGEIVMFKYKKLHEETNHGFLKLNDEPGPRPSWDSSSQRSSFSRTSTASNSGSPFSDGNYRPMPLRTTSLLDTTLYSFPEEYRPPVRQTKANAETYKQITRRLDCKTEYIRNLLHDSASITVPIRTNAMTPRNRFSHSKGPAPLPPTPSTPTAATPISFTATPAPYVPYGALDDLPLAPPPPPEPAVPSQQPQRRPTPSTELMVPCDYCTLVLPHRDLTEHEAVCGRSYLSTERAQASARRRREIEEWGEMDDGGIHRGAAYGFDGDEAYYSAYRTMAPRDSSAENGFSGGVSSSAAAKVNCSASTKAAPSPFDFNRPACQPPKPITVSSLLSPSGTDYAPSRPSLVSTLATKSTSTSSISAASNSGEQQSCAGAAAAAASGNISPEVHLPCEFCADMIPASQLLRHQATCF